MSKLVWSNVFFHRRYNNIEFPCTFNISASKLLNAVVSLTTDPNQEPRNVMKLRQYFRSGRQMEFAVCIGGPVRGCVGKSWFVEYMEASRIFGANKVLLHNMSSCHDIDAEMAYYVKHGTARGPTLELPGGRPSGFLVAADGTYTLSVPLPWYNQIHRPGRRWWTDHPQTPRRQNMGR